MRLLGRSGCLSLPVIALGEWLLVVCLWLLPERLPDVESKTYSLRMPPGAAMDAPRLAYVLGFARATWCHFLCFVLPWCGLFPLQSRVDSFHLAAKCRRLGSLTV